MEVLRKTVKPKLAFAARELAEVAAKFRAHWDKHQAGGKQVFIKTLEYYIKALKFDPSIVVTGLDEEIKVLNQEIEKKKKAKEKKVWSLIERVNLSEE